MSQSWQSARLIKKIKKINTFWKDTSLSVESVNNSTFSKYVCPVTDLSAGFHKNYWTGLDKIEWRMSLSPEWTK